MLRSVHGSSGFHQDLLPGIEMGASAGYASPLVSRQLADCGRVFASSPLPSRFSALVVTGPGHCDKWEKSDLQPSTQVPYLGMVIDTSQEMMLPSEARMSRFQDLAIRFHALPSPARMWQQLPGHMASLECFLPRGHRRMHHRHWRLKDLWSPMSDTPSLPAHLLPERAEVVRWWLQEDRWLAGISLQVPPPSLLLFTDAPLSGWGAHLLDLTASRVWSQEERFLHINVLEMWAVVLALAAFFPQLCGQSVVLMSNNATTKIPHLTTGFRSSNSVDNRIHRKARIPIWLTLQIYNFTL